VVKWGKLLREGILALGGHARTWRLIVMVSIIAVSAYGCHRRSESQCRNGRKALTYSEPTESAYWNERKQLVYNTPIMGKYMAGLLKAFAPPVVDEIVARGDAAKPHLQAWVMHPSAELRFWSIYMLGEVSSSRADLEFLTELKDDPQWRRQTEKLRRGSLVLGVLGSSILVAQDRVLSSDSVKRATETVAAETAQPTVDGSEAEMKSEGTMTRRIGN